MGMGLRKMGIKTVLLGELEEEGAGKKMRRRRDVIDGGFGLSAPKERLFQQTIQNEPQGLTELVTTSATSQC